MQTQESNEPMRVVHPRCRGIDARKRETQACLLVETGDGRVWQEQRAFGTTTEELLQLADWLGAAGCTSVGLNQSAKVSRCLRTAAPPP